MPRRRPRRRQRTPQGEATRARILTAARVAVEEGFQAFTIDRVALRAGVSRMTVYYQFGSKHDLLEALFDWLADRGGLDRLAEAFRRPDALEALETFIEVFCGFWASDRVGIRRLRGWASLDPEAEKGGQGRDAWRREGMEVIVRRLREEYDTPPPARVAETIDLLHTLTSFESYDNLARTGRRQGEIVALLTRAARAVVGQGPGT